MRNAQGDVVQIRDSQNQAIANYHYDAWGKLLSITDANGNSQSITNETFSFDNTSIACINPIRYRGYIYDNETGFYYLNSRYYDPSLRRFVNEDSFASTGQGIAGYNMFAYCNNNPVNYFDRGGDNATSVLTWWTTTMWAPAVAEPTIFGEIAYGIGCGILGVAAVAETVFLTGAVQDAVDTYTAESTPALSKSIPKVDKKDITLPRLPRKDPVHHIVAQHDSRAKQAQDVLEAAGIDRFTDPANLVQLPFFYHKGLHTTAYYEYVNTIIFSAWEDGGKEGVYSALVVLKWEISSGAIW